MKVMQIQDDWGPENIKPSTRPDPEPGPRDVIVAIKAVAINPRDLILSRRGYGRFSGKLPLIPLCDGAGEIVAIGDEVTRVAVGDRVCPIFSQNWMHGTIAENTYDGVLGGPLDGTMQELMLLSEEGVVRFPAHMSFAEAATLPCAAVTAWNALVEQGRTKAGDKVLIQGTGGVSMFALQIAKMQGAEVILTSSSNEKLGRAKKMGADHLINYRDNPDWHKNVREITSGHGVDHIVEVGGAGTLEKSIASIRTSGVISVIGVLAGFAGELSLGRIVTQNIRMQGITVGSRAAMESMIRAMTHHRTKPAIDENRFEFEELGTALLSLSRGKHFGKVVCEF